MPDIKISISGNNGSSSVDKKISSLETVFLKKLKMMDDKIERRIDKLENTLKKALKSRPSYSTKVINNITHKQSGYMPYAA